MYDTTPTTERIAPDHREASPSTGKRETKLVLGVAPGRGTCDAPGCDRPGEPVTILNGDTVERRGVRCDDHDKPFLEVSS